MKKLLLILLAVATLGAAAYFLFFSKGNKYHAYVSRDAAYVATIDLKSIYEKGNFKDFSKLEMWKVANEEVKDKPQQMSQMKIFEEALKDPASTGIDFTAPMVMSMKWGEATYGMPDMIPTVVIPLKDQALFEAFIKKIDEKSRDKDSKEKNGVIEKNGYKIFGKAQKEKDRSDGGIFGWNAEAAIIMGTTYRNSEKLAEKFDSTITKKITPITNDRLFEKCADMGGDINFAMNGLEYFEIIETMGGSSMRKIYEKIKPYTDFFSGSTITFENGKIESKSASFFRNSDHKKMFEKFLGEKPSVNPLELLSSNKPLFAMNFTINMDQVWEMAGKFDEAKKMMSEMAGSLSVSEEELKGLLSGQISLAFNGVRADSAERVTYLGDTIMERKTIFDAGMFIGVKNAAAVDKILTALRLEKVGNVYKIPESRMFSVNVVKAKEGVVILMDDRAAETLAAKGKLSDGKFDGTGDLMMSGSGSVYVNLDMATWSKDTREMISSGMGTDNFATLTEIMNYFVDGRAYMTDKTESKSELNFKDKSKNSLEQLIKIIDKGVVKVREAEKKREEEYRKYQDSMMRMYEEPAIIGDEPAYNYEAPRMDMKEDRRYR